MNQESIDLMNISLGCLAVVFFLSAIRQLEVDPLSNEFSEAEQFGSNELLSSTIIPKVLHLATSVTTFGILLFI